MRKAGAAFLPRHEVRCLLQIPRALRLIEDHDVLNRRARFDQRIIAEVVNVLNECFDAFADFPFAHLLSLLFSPRNFVACQRFT